MQAVLRIDTRSYKWSDIKSNTKWRGALVFIVFLVFFYTTSGELIPLGYRFSTRNIILQYFATKLCKLTK